MTAYIMIGAVCAFLPLFAIKPRNIMERPVRAFAMTKKRSSHMKLFGGASGARTAGGRSGSVSAVRTKAPKQRNLFKPLAIVLAVVLFVEGCWFFVVFTNNSLISY